MRTWIGWAVAVATTAAVPGGATAQTLEDALVEAYTVNAHLLAARAALRAVDETVPAALSGWRPTLEISSSAGKRALRQSGIFGDGSTQNMSPASVGVRLSQPLFRGGATMAQTQASEARVLAGRASLTEVEQQVLAAAASAYVTVIRDQSVIDLNVNNEQVLARQLQATRDRFHVGEVTRTDVSQAEARSADARASRIAAEGNLEASRATYENLIGTAPGTLEFPTMSVFSVPETVEAALDLGLQRNPTVLRADALAAAARHDIDAAAARVLPHVTLSASAQRSWDPNSFSSKTDVAEIVTSLVVPLYQSGAEYARIRELREVAVQRRREVDAERRSIRESVAQGWERLQTAQARVSAFQASVEANGIALEGVEQEAAVGARTVLDVLDAEQELFEARVNLVRAEAEAATATFQLLSVAGGMTARELALPTPLYDPVAHYDAVRGKWLGFGGNGEAAPPAAAE